MIKRNMQSNSKHNINFHISNKIT